MDTLNDIYESNHWHPDQLLAVGHDPRKVGNMIGELDMLAELHRLLYEVE